MRGALFGMTVVLALAASASARADQVDYKGLYGHPRHGLRFADLELAVSRDWTRR